MSTRYSALLILLTVFCGSISSSLAANIQGPKRSVLDRLEDEDAVRKRRLYRKGRISVAPALGMTLNDAFRRNVLIGVDSAYNFTDELAVGLSGMFGLTYNSSLADQLEEKRSNSVSRGGFTDISYVLTSEAIYTPIYGKAAFAGRISVAYDIHFLGGGGIMGFSGGGALDTASPVISLGAGMRVFVQRALSVSFQVRDYLVYRADNTVPDVYADEEQGGLSNEKSLSNQFALMLSCGFFFPQAPQTSN